MPLAEGVSARVVYKAYASGAMTSNAEPAPATDPGAAGGKILRRVSSSLNLAKDTFESNEVRTDRQRADFRHGSRRAQGAISGELSPATYFDFMSAAHRDTPVGPISLSKTELTSLAASASAGTLTFGGGDPVAAGLRVGDIIRVAGAAVAGNNGVNYLITGFSGTSNRTVAVSPSPVDAAADTGAWTLTRPGKSSIIPSTGFIKRKFAMEIFHEDTVDSRLFTEMRVSGYRMSLPVNGMNTIDTNFMGRNMQLLEDAASPFFTNPAAPTTTGVTAAVDGVLLLGGQRIGLLTSLDLTLDLNASAAAVRGQKFPAEIFLGRAGLSGNGSAYFEDVSIVKAFANELELELLTSVFADSSSAADGLGIYLPRIKLTSADLGIQGEGGQQVNFGFTALKYQGSKAGVENTTIRIHDTAAA